ncbi:MAG TPA: hypothetical protein VLH38_00790 [Patescibacteria group bacterium]|nr:hypothetical protein [Patescibacteria group bacterium]
MNLQVTLVVFYDHLLAFMGVVEGLDGNKPVKSAMHRPAACPFLDINASIDWIE